MSSSLPVASPRSIEAERTTIGALLIDPERIVDVLPVLQPQDFYDPVLRVIYEAICQLYEDRKPIDFLTVSEVLRSNKKIEAIGGSAFLARLGADVPTAAHAGEYAEIIRNPNYAQPQ